MLPLRNAPQAKSDMGKRVNFFSTKLNPQVGSNNRCLNRLSWRIQLGLFWCRFKLTARDTALPTLRNLNVSLTIKKKVQTSSRTFWPNLKIGYVGKSNKIRNRGWKGSGEERRGLMLWITMPRAPLCLWISFPSVPISVERLSRTRWCLHLYRIQSFLFLSNHRN